MTCQGFRRPSVGFYPHYPHFGDCNRVVIMGVIDYRSEPKDVA